MEIPAGQILKNDFVHGFGTVLDIRRFYRQEAIRGRTIDKERRGFDNLDYARLVAEQQEQLYNEVLDSVKIFGDAGTSRTFSADTVVSVFRVVRQAV